MVEALRRYAERRLNPFLGVQQVIANAHGRALSVDGLNWEIQLYAERRVGWGSLDTTVQQVLYRHGVWSERDGLACFPTPPTMARQTAREWADELVAATRAARDALPFPLADRYEHWLLESGTDGQPLALLGASDGTEPLRSGRGADLNWRCAPNDAIGLDSGLRTELESQVRNLAGRPVHSRWFRREIDGSGVALAPAPGVPGCQCAPADAIILPGPAFPDLLLNEATWADPRDQERVREYLDWMSPRLLMLPLPAATRDRVESAAATQALLVDQFHRLYPQVNDAPLLVRLRVEAQLRRSRTPTAEGIR